MPQIKMQLDQGHDASVDRRDSFSGKLKKTAKMALPTTTFIHSLFDMRIFNHQIATGTAGAVINKRERQLQSMSKMKSKPNAKR